MIKLSCGPLWKENNKWENVELCYILSMQLTGGLKGRPTYGFVHDFRTCFFERDGFLVHGIRCDGFRSMVLDASSCINMYCNIERNIMKNQAGSAGFGIQGKISVYMCFMCYALALFIFCVLEFVCR